MKAGSTIRTLLDSKSLGDAGFLLFFRVVSGDYGKPWKVIRENDELHLVFEFMEVRSPDVTVESWLVVEG